MWNEELDPKFHHRVAKAARASPSSRVLVILNGGPHHFSQFLDHSHAMHFRLHDSFRYPQEWIDSYHDGASRLLDAFSPRTLPPNACVLWRTSNVGPRIGDVPGQRAPASRRQHPSARNGLHEWLNRWSSALVRKAGIPVLELSDLTADLPLTGSLLEAFDYYHGFNSSLLLLPFVERACTACGWQRHGLAK